MRVFPLSNWTEMDVWEYIEEENIELVPLYFAKKRDFVIRGGVKIMVDDNRFPLSKDEKIQNDYIRFRTLGCYPLTGAIDSKANSISKIVKELKESKYSERQGRLIDGDQESSMERKKKEGYF
jgi:sulfate adenylyltransferase subunit 2